jgi:hypothetical protein
MRIQTIMMAVALAGCGIETETDDLDTGETESASSVEQWTPARSIPGQRSVYQPGLAFFNGQLRMVHSGYSNPSELWYSAFNGVSWSTNAKLNGITSHGGPSLIVHGGVMKMIYRLSNRLMMSTYSGSGSTFYAPVTIGSYLGTESLRSEPATALLNGQLYVAYCSSQAVRVDRLNSNNTWTNVVRKTFSDSRDYCEHVELAAVRDPNPYYLFWNLHLEYAVANTYFSNMPLYEMRSGDGTSWTAQASLNRESMQPMSIAECNATTHFIHGGNVYAPNQIRWMERIGYSWGSSFQVPAKFSTSGAALGCYGSRTIMVYPDDNSNDDLRWSEFGP